MKLSTGLSVAAVLAVCTTGTVQAVSFPDHLVQLLDLHNCYCDIFHRSYFTLSCNDLQETLQIYQKHNNETVVRHPHANDEPNYYLQTIKRCSSTKVNITFDWSTDRLVLKRWNFSTLEFQTIALAVSDAFKGVTSLEISNSKFLKIPEDFFKTTTKLEDLVLNNVHDRNGSAVQIPAAFFQRNSNLKYLKINQSSISFTELPLDRLEQLSYLELSGNSLRRLPDNFRVSGKNNPLNIIKLIDNDLEELPEDIFGNFRELAEVDLSGNRFSRVPDNLFKNNRQLRVVNWRRDGCSFPDWTRKFPENFLAANPNLKSFRYSAKNTSSCQTISFPGNFFGPDSKVLNHLEVTNTPMTWNDFEPLLTQLEIVSMLDLSQNKFSRINVSSLDKKFDTLVLTGNALDCSECRTFEFLENCTGCQMAEDPADSDLICRDSSNNDVFWKPYCENQEEWKRNQEREEQVRILAFVLPAVILFFAVGLVVIYRTKRIHVWVYNHPVLSRIFFPETETSPKTFDVFLSYSESDADFAG